MNNNMSSKQLFTCGAISILMDHQPGDPTIYDSIFAVFKRLFAKRTIISDAATSSEARKTLIRRIPFKKLYQRQNRAA